MFHMFIQGDSLSVSVVLWFYGLSNAVLLHHKRKSDILNESPRVFKYSLNLVYLRLNIIA